MMSDYPKIIEFTGDKNDMLQWGELNILDLSKDLAHTGAILLRQTGMTSIDDFMNIINQLKLKSFGKNGEHVPIGDNDVVQTPVFYPPENKILWHNENTFNHRFPGKIIFACLEASASGGETIFLDTRKIINLMDKDILNRFKKKKVMYIRNYIKGFGLTYEKTLGIKDKSEVDAYCKKNKINYEWNGDVLKTRSIRPAVITHPLTFDQCFVAQGHHWHQSQLSEEVRDSLIKYYGESNLPRNFCYGDGDPIEYEIMDHLTEIYESLEILRPWQSGDILILDNIVSAHARNPFLGERSLLVSLSDPLIFDEVNNTAIISN